jgi:hypothetical protein
MRFKNKNIRTKNKDTRCAKPMWKHIFIMLTYANINIKDNITRLWCKIVPKSSVKQIEGNEGTYFYLYPFRDLVQRSFQRGFYVCKNIS